MVLCTLKIRRRFAKSGAKFPSPKLLPPGGGVLTIFLDRYAPFRKKKWTRAERRNGGPLERKILKTGGLLEREKIYTYIK